MAEAQLGEQQQQQPHSGIGLHVANAAAAAPAPACVLAAAQAPQKGTQAASRLVSAADLATCACRVPYR